MVTDRNAIQVAKAALTSEMSRLTITHVADNMTTDEIDVVLTEHGYDLLNDALKILEEMDATG